MKIEVYPYGPDIQRHFEELRAAGVASNQASEASRSFDVEWPDAMRLPVVGDSLSIEWAHGYVSSVWLGSENGEWNVRIHLGPERG